MKKIISILLAIVMCFTMTTVAFAEDTTEDINTSDIKSILLELAKLASDLNDEAREKAGEELKQLIVEKLAGDSALLQGVADKLIDAILDISGSDNLLDIDKEQAEKLADLLTKLYDGNIADAIDNPILKIIVKFIPEDVMKELVVWILSDGLGDALDDFIENNGGEVEKPDEPVEEEKPGIGTGDVAVIITAAWQALKDVFNEVIGVLSSLFGSIQTSPETVA